MSGSDALAETEALEIIRHFYQEDTPLRRMLLKHSRQVCGKALEIMQNPAAEKLPLNRRRVIMGALLHDIGIFACDAPGILCMGDQPYLAHGTIGGRLLREYGRLRGLDLEAFARICERHTGTGITAAEIRAQHLPLPELDLLPETPEEKLICLADKFFSKSGDMQEKSMARIRRSLEKFEPDSTERWDSLCRTFGLPQNP